MGGLVPQFCVVLIRYKELCSKSKIGEKPEQYLSSEFGRSPRHFPMGGQIRAPPKSRVCFEGNPLDGSSLRRLCFMDRGNVGSPDTLYFTEITGASVEPDGRYIAYANVFDRVA